ncbi:hypothetical protein V8G54_009677 [Vigna mungo]|uniref:E3 ubiquitin-protein ligase CHIP n=1 Tax=Vigna mungo TaxID=3915 RepID=A0AAQ3NUZ9_VIGMU
MGPNAAAAKQAEQLRINGNTYFKKDRFGAAIDAYTEAITLCPNVPIYWTNRALCHLKRNDWERVEEDSRKAIQLDSNSVKAHYMLGLALLRRQESAKGIKELEKQKQRNQTESENCKPGGEDLWFSGSCNSFEAQSFYPFCFHFKCLMILLLFVIIIKALDLGRGANPKGYMVEEIWQELAKAKYHEWERSSSKRAWKLQSLKEACESALKEKHFLEFSEAEGFVDDPTTSHSEQLEALEVVFNIAAEADTPTEVPDYLCCRITLDIFHDPVITPSGLTYERAVILEHLQKVGKFDPITREPLDQSQLVPNLAIKEAVQAFLDKHGWAYKVD